VGASERDEFLRAAWRTLVANRLGMRGALRVRGRDGRQHLTLSPIYACSRRGQRAYFLRAARNWGANVTLLSSMTRDGMGPSLAVEGPTTREVFEAYVE
jgi:hypothetical protein